MLLFLVEEQVFTFFHDYKAANIDLPQDVFTSISCLSIDQQYTIEGKTTVRRVGYEIVNNQCIVGDRVFRVLPNGNVDFPINQDCVEFASTSPNYVCDSIKPYAFSIYSAEDYGFLACVRGEPLRDNMPIEYVQGYEDGKHRSIYNCVAQGWICIDLIAVPSEWFFVCAQDEIEYDIDEEYYTKVYFGSHANCRDFEELNFITTCLYELLEDRLLNMSNEEISKVFKKAS